jgi:hypothetical protein
MTQQTVMTLSEYLDAESRGVMFVGRGDYDALSHAAGASETETRTLEQWRECVNAFRFGRAAGHEFALLERMWLRNIADAERSVRIRRRVFLSGVAHMDRG